jgi:hypothetical protein
MAITVSLTTVQQAIAQAIKNAPADRVRIERAAGLIAMGRVQQVAELVFTVGSQNTPSVFYAVTPSGCECMDTKRLPSQRCKHE